jgi:hypothetical protein
MLCLPRPLHHATTFSTPSPHLIVSILLSRPISILLSRLRSVSFRCLFSVMYIDARNTDHFERRLLTQDRDSASRPPQLCLDIHCGSVSVVVRRPQYRLWIPDRRLRGYVGLVVVLVVVSAVKF